MENPKSVNVQILNAFVDHNKGGNPAGVVLDADQFSWDEKLKIAAAIGLSETAFVSKSSIADFKLDFFTPSRQIAHCGHATIATFSYLSQQGKVKAEKTSKETIDGRREILIKGDLAFMEQNAPKYIDVSHRKNEILKSLSLRSTDILEGAPILLVNTGNSFILVPVSDSKVLKNIKPDFDLIAQVSAEFDLIGYYVFTTDTGNTERDANTRMFGPRYSIMEESGTGMAAGPLACYLYDILHIKKHTFLIQQGWFMEIPSPSLIIVDLEIENDNITGLMAGGKGIVMAQKTIEI